MSTLLLYIKPKHFRFYFFKGSVSSKITMLCYRNAYLPSRRKLLLRKAFALRRSKCLLSQSQFLKIITQWPVFLFFFFFFFFSNSVRLFMVAFLGWSTTSVFPLNFEYCIDISYVLEFDMLSSDEGSKLSGPGLLSMSAANNLRKNTHNDAQANDSKKV